jgi:O-antigen/teichoic acid export membrane protein
MYADSIVILLLGEQWQTAGRVTQLLTAAAACRGVVHGVTPAMLVLKQPAADARYKFIETIVFLPTLLTGVYCWALPGAALAAGISYGLAMIFRVCWASKWDFQVRWLSKAVELTRIFLQ